MTKGNCQRRKKEFFGRRTKTKGTVVNYRLPLDGQLVACYYCRRKILVEECFFDAVHLPLLITCWECLPEKQKQNANKRYGIVPGGKPV